MVITAWPDRIVTSNTIDRRIMHISEFRKATIYSAVQGLCVVLFAFCILAFGALPAQAAVNKKYASIVLDADTGMILHQRYADKILHPASLTKMMTLMMTFDALERGELRLRDRVVISRHAASMVPSKLDLPVGSTIRVEDAIYVLVTKSANDVAAALAEKLKGSEARFAAYMTTKAREIGMSNTRFTNASGLHDPNQVTTARDIAKMSQYLIRNYPQYYHYFSTRKFTYRGKTYRNHNRLIESYDGMDGLKTGYINASGFNLAASAVRNNRRIIGVVFGGRSSSTRNAHMKKLLDNGFAQLNSVLMASANIPLPEKKPVTNMVLASMGNNVQPSSGYATDDIERDNPEWEAMNEMMQGKAFSSMIGEGDIDPAASKRLETGLLAISAVRNLNRSDTEANRNQRDAALQNDQRPKPWAIQVGAFTSRVKTESALRLATADLPDTLSNAVPIIVPLKTSRGWLFRARLSGFEKEEALQACRIIKDCLPVSPRAY